MSETVLLWCLVPCVLMMLFGTVLLFVALFQWIEGKLVKK